MAKQTEKQWRLGNSGKWRSIVQPVQYGGSTVINYHGAGYGATQGSCAKCQQALTRPYILVEDDNGKRRYHLKCSPYVLSFRDGPRKSFR